MRSIFAVLTLGIFLFTACNPNTGTQTAANDSLEGTPNETLPVPDLDTLCTLNHAQTILGQPVMIVSNVTEKTGERLTRNTKYSALSTDAEGHLGNVYFTYTEFKDLDSAVASFASVKKANEGNGIGVLDGYGDEAFMGSDATSYYMIIARKGNKEVRIKLHHITVTSQKANFLMVCRKITDML